MNKIEFRLKELSKKFFEEGKILNEEDILFLLDYINKLKDKNNTLEKIIREKRHIILT